MIALLLVCICNISFTGFGRTAKFLLLLFGSTILFSFFDEFLLEKCERQFMFLMYLNLNQNVIKNINILR